MPFDALVVAALEKELQQQLANCRITKVYQPRPLVFTLLCRRPGTNFNLVISADPANPGAYLTDSKYENPETPPSFCMLLRKHLENARIISVRQPGLERILLFQVENLSSSGQTVQRTLIAELMGRYSNMVLLDEKGIIIDAARRITSRVNRVRELIPEVRYEPPPPQNKRDPLQLRQETFFNLLYPTAPDSKVANLLVKYLQGLSPLMARELVYRAGFNPEVRRGEVDDTGFYRLWSVAADTFEAVKEGHFRPTLLLEQGTPSDFAAIKLTHLSDGCWQEFNSMSRVLQLALEYRMTEYEMRQKRAALARAVDTALQRVERKIQQQARTLAEAESADSYRIKGELLTASLHLVRPGMTEVEVPNYYSSRQEPIEISLDPGKSAAANAQAYFKKYSKLRNSVQATKRQLAKSREEKQYLEQVAASIETAESSAELDEIREELIQEGYLKKAGKKKRSRTRRSEPERFISSDGLEILVGHNNRQNDALTMGRAKSADLWFHVKDIPGSHVIVRTEGKGEAPQATLEEAALLAAHYSRARDSSNVPVDYTQRKHVRKPKGARPGMVIYDNQQTVYVTPSRKRIDEIRRQPPIR